MVMYSVDEKRRKREYSKYTGAAAQNDDFYSSLNNISMKVVAIGGPL
jgi:hypothetical protein